MESGELRSGQTNHCFFKSLDRPGGQSVKYARNIETKITKISGIELYLGV